jgi:hypothetical protein
VSLREQMQAVYEEHGRLTAPLVVEAARPEDHPLHHRFEWDDAIAGPRYREVQAADLIRKCKIKFREQEGRKPEGWVRAFHAVRDVDTGESGYEPVEEIVRSELQTRMLLAQMKHEWQALKRKYQDFEEFWELLRDEAA